jgi:hypothetical protein
MNANQQLIIISVTLFLFGMIAYFLFEIAVNLKEIKNEIQQTKCPK